MLSVLSRNDVLTIADISDQVNLSKPTISKIVSHLEEKGYVLDVGKGESTDSGGKKPVLYKFNDTLKYGISIITNTYNIIGAIHDLKGNILFQHEIDDDFDDYELTLTTTANMINQLIDEMHIGPEDVCGIAVACEGVIDSLNGIVRYPIQHKNWGVNKDLKTDLGAILDFNTDIYLENICCYAGFNEIMNDEFHNLESLVTINTIENTGGCVIRDNTLLKGNNGYVGEVGHMVVDFHSNIECTCGAKGCFEALVSPNNVLEEIPTYKNAFPDSLLFEENPNGPDSITTLFSAADQGDELAMKIIDKIAQYFAILIHNISLLQDPDAIIIEGTYANSCKYFENKLLQRIDSFPFYKLEHNIQIFFSNENNFNSFLVGAAFYIYHNYFNNDALYA